MLHLKATSPNHEATNSDNTVEKMGLFLIGNSSLNVKVCYLELGHFRKIFPGYWDHDASTGPAVVGANVHP